MKTFITFLAAMLFAVTQTFAATVNFTVSSTSTNFPNPERGVASWAGSDLVNSYDGASLSSAYSNGDRLASCLINLSAYRTAAIASTWLETLDARLKSVKALGMKCVMWFSYDNSNSGNDASASQIVSHLTQLAPVFAANADAIAFFKAGFVGAYGEWWGSQAGNTCCYSVPAGTTQAQADANQDTIRTALLAAVPKNVVIQYRYPTHIMRWSPTVLSSSDAFTGSPQSRTAFHNDCWMSTNDTGTYSSGGTGTTQRTYTQNLTNYTPFGGEVANNCTDSNNGTNNSCTTLLTQSAQWHVSWLKNPNTASATNYYNAWVSGGCWTTFQATVGYRINYTQLVTPTSITKGTTGTFTLSLYNNGWSRMHQQRRVQVVLRKQTTGETITGSMSSTLQTLPSQSTTAIARTIKVSVPSGAVSGTYDVLLRIPDIHTSTATTRNFMVRPMVTDGSGVAWNNTTGELATGVTVSIP